VLLEHPLYLDFLGMVGGWDNDAAWMKWRPQEGVRVHLVTLDGSKVGVAAHFGSYKGSLARLGSQ
jgi:hypothetical protein